VTIPSLNRDIFGHIVSKTANRTRPASTPSPSSTPEMFDPLQTEDYARAILSARPDGNLADLEEQAGRPYSKTKHFGTNARTAARPGPRPGPESSAGPRTRRPPGRRPALPRARRPGPGWACTSRARSAASRTPPSGYLTPPA